MKKILGITVLFIVASIIIISCKKEEDRVVIDSNAKPTLSANSQTLVLTQAAADSDAVVFSWSPVDYGFNAAINYSLQIAKAGTDFAPAATTEVALTFKDLQKGFTNFELNKELLKIVPAGAAVPLQARLKSDVGNIYSNVVDLIVTPYRDLILYTYPKAINVAGNFQGWSPGVAPQIVSIADDGIYEGFINFTDPSPEFKFVKGNDWPFGDFGSGGVDKLGSDGNLKLTNGAGVYYIKANTKDLTWTNYKVDSWGLIGDATPTGWDSDTDLTYDPATGVWSITVDLKDGDIKFRANNDWVVNLGDKKPADGVPEINGDNIPVTAGNYTINLNVSVGGNWYYSLKKN